MQIIAGICIVVGLIIFGMDSPYTEENGSKTERTSASGLGLGLVAIGVGIGGLILLPLPFNWIAFIIGLVIFGFATPYLNRKDD